jgi:hypothetical protein
LSYNSHYQHLRALLAIAIIALVGLTVTVVVLAINNGSTTTASTATRANLSTVRAQASVQPNADERGLPVSPTPLGSNSSYYYPGHY